MTKKTKKISTETTTNMTVVSSPTPVTPSVSELQLKIQGLESEKAKLEEYCGEYNNDIMELLKKYDELRFDFEYIKSLNNSLNGRVNELVAESSRSFWNKLKNWF